MIRRTSALQHIRVRQSYRNLIWILFPYPCRFFNAFLLVRAGAVAAGTSSVLCSPASKHLHVASHTRLARTIPTLSIPTPFFSPASERTRVFASLQACVRRCNAKLSVSLSGLYHMRRFRHSPKGFSCLKTLFPTAMGLRPRLPVGDSFLVTPFEPRLLRLRLLALRRKQAPNADLPRVGVHLDPPCTGIRTPRKGRTTEGGSGSPAWVSCQGGRNDGPFVDRQRLRSPSVLGGDGVECAPLPTKSPKDRRHVSECMQESSCHRYVGKNSHQEMERRLAVQFEEGIKAVNSTTLLEEPQARDDRHHEMDDPDSNDAQGSAWVSTCAFVGFRFPTRLLKV